MLVWLAIFWTWNNVDVVTKMCPYNCSTLRVAGGQVKGTFKVIEIKRRKMQTKYKIDGKTALDSKTTLPSCITSFQITEVILNKMMRGSVVNMIVGPLSATWNSWVSPLASWFFVPAIAFLDQAFYMPLQTGFGHLLTHEKAWSNTEMYVILLYVFEFLWVLEPTCSRILRSYHVPGGSVKPYESLSGLWLYYKFT